jgi:hypothetical protein
MTNGTTWLEMAFTNIPASEQFFGDLFDWPVLRDEQIDDTMTGFEPEQTGVGFSPVGGERSAVAAASTS